MLELSSPESPQPASPRTREGPEVMQAFLGRHIPFLVLVAVLLAQLILLAFQVTRKHNVRLIKVWTVDAFDPFERSLRGLTDATSGVWNAYHDLWQAQRENQSLRRELTGAHSQLLKLSQEGAENTRLRALLGLGQRLPLRSLAAAVIAASPGSGSAIFIDKGSADGLATDMPVITPEGVAGKVIAVFHSTAQVLTLTDRTSGAGSMLAKNGVQGVLEGEGNGFCRLDYIMNEENVQPGDVVVTSGMDQIYPKGLLVGTVVKVSEGSVYKDITVRPAAALDRLEDVLVILKDSKETKKDSHSRARR
ncbi:MAG TPA: rod shape-determining protein MreC [Terriglobia bacterium]|nr:rod shape-determining protein MreC [Terriglobia bacterium]